MYIYVHSRCIPAGHATHDTRCFTPPHLRESVPSLHGPLSPLSCCRAELQTRDVHVCVGCGRLAVVRANTRVTRILAYRCRPHQKHTAQHTSPGRLAKRVHRSSLLNGLLSLTVTPRLWPTRQSQTCSRVDSRRTCGPQPARSLHVASLHLPAPSSSRRPLSDDVMTRTYPKMPPWMLERFESNFLAFGMPIGALSPKMPPGIEL